MIPLAVTSLRRKAAVGALIVLLAWASTLGLDLAGILKPYSLKTLDLLFRITSLSPASPEVVVVTVDQPDLDFFQKQGVSWPWPRQLYAPIIEFCRRGGARAVIFDVLYTENSVYGAEDDQQLAQTVAASGDVILPVVLSRGTKETGPPSDEVLAKASLPFQGPPPPGLTTYQGLTAPIPPLLKAAAGLGTVNSYPDSDGIYRRIPLISICRGRVLPILTFAAFCHFQKKGPWHFEAGELVRGNYRVPVDEAGRLLLKFRGPSRSFKRFSAANVIQSEVRLQHGKAPFYQPEDFAGKWVLLGFTAPGLYDLKPSPLAPTFPGVELLATLLDNLLQGDFLRIAAMKIRVPVQCHVR